MSFVLKTRIDAGRFDHANDLWPHHPRSFHGRRHSSKQHNMGFRLTFLDNVAIMESLLRESCGGREMKRITLRSIPENAKKALYRDLDHLAGLWSREETAVSTKA